MEQGYNFLKLKQDMMVVTLYIIKWGPALT